ncbi:hypothetical protein EDC45_0845 [Mesocricetibacter intestinalis]|uniref:Zinc-ribbon domain-containing protein n=1 Tax=Mesocricetibacter intestinalis TaxID=1521930 RepID=A0A4R6VBP1_9PAST|nr:zinc ribbon domain-containing protein [Mesocricetibacter intestinalis]TDQ59053.1 hypothetical protein EDC45_0845 [Mesocricetibacter intestinalis]
MFCNQCGKKVEVNQQFCSNCGQALHQKLHQKKQEKTSYQAQDSSIDYFVINNVSIYHRILSFISESLLSLWFLVIYLIAVIFPFPYDIELKKTAIFLLLLGFIIFLLFKPIYYLFKKKPIWGSVLGFGLFDIYGQPISICKYCLRSFIKCVFLLPIIIFIYHVSMGIIYYEIEEQGLYFTYWLILNPISIPFIFAMILKFSNNEDWAPRLFYDKWLGIYVMRTEINNQKANWFTLTFIIIHIILAGVYVLFAELNLNNIHNKLSFNNYKPQVSVPTHKNRQIKENEVNSYQYPSEGNKGYVENYYTEDKYSDTYSNSQFEKLSKSFPDYSSEIETIKGFYYALSIADGELAASYVIPSKRRTAAFNPINISRFYSSLREPLVLEDISKLSYDQFTVRYHYRASKTQCNGEAILTLVNYNGYWLIQKIKANC